jgi:hypothetical protein
MTGKRKTFKQRFLYAPLLQNLLGKAVREIRVDEKRITLKTRRREDQYLWSQIERVELHTGIIRGGYPGSSAAMKRTLKITTIDRTYEFDVSPRRSQIKDHPELLRELGQHINVRRTSSD